MSRFLVASLCAAAALAGGCGESTPATTEGSRAPAAERMAPRPPRECFPGTDAIPCVAGVEAGIAYPYRLYTHCGVLGAYFDGRWWRAEPPLSDGSGNPPEGWGNPFEDGTMTLVERDLARFQGQSGQRAQFVRLERAAKAPSEGCA